MLGENIDKMAGLCYNILRKQAVKGGYPMNQLSILKQMFESLSDGEKSKFLEYLKGEPQRGREAFDNLNQLILSHNYANAERPCCPRCKSIYVVKNGHVNGVQRYMCKDCKKTFAITNNTILHSTKKPVETWKKYLECMMNKFSLRKCAEVCEIDLTTAFVWRHKILDALQNMHNEVTINGVAQVDETYFSVSYKGNHAKSDFMIPRDAHKRGCEDKKRGISKDKVCVLCSVNLDGLSIGMISNLGRPCVKDLKAVFSNRIEKGSILVTDSFRGYSKLAFENELTHIAVPRGKHTNGAFNIQTINSYHSELKRLVQRNFKGVSTKYLNNYVVYHNFVNFAKGDFSTKLNILQEHTFTTWIQAKSKEIQLREAIPMPHTA